MTTNITSLSGSRHNGITRSLIPMIFFVLSISTSAQIQAPQQGVTGGPDPADNGVVGNLQGIFSQSPSGSMIYTVPFPVLPGTNGMTPELNLIYNSQSGNGLLGMGFHLGGLSSIARIGSNLYNDGEIKAIQFSYNDHFALDGNRLTLDVGTYGASGSEYHTESQTFSKIIAFGTQGKGPEYFKVYTKSGLIYWYGYSQDSRIEGQGLVDVLQWRLNRVEDRRGNYIDYYYYESNSTGENLPIRISYTGNHNTSSLPYYTILIEYQNRSDSAIHYLAGCKVNTYKRVSNVKLLFNENEVWELACTYSESNNAPYYSYLQSITYSDAEFNRHLNPLEFLWSGEGTNSLNSPETKTCIYGLSLAPADYPRFLTDIDGDGLDDILGFEYNGTIASFSNGTSFGSWVPVYSDFGAVDLWNLTGTMSCQGTDDYILHKYHRTIGDVNGDGKTDIIGFGHDGTGVSVSVGATYTSLCYVNDFNHGSGNYPYLETNPRYVSDVNGDGMDDIIAFNHFGVRVATSYGTGFNAPSVWTADFANNSGLPGSGFDWNEFETVDDECHPSYIRTIGDVNGDGMTDIIGFGKYATYAYKSNGTEFVQYAVLYDFHEADGWNTRNYPRFVADVNGDGMDDIIGYGDDGVYVSLSTGTGFLPKRKWIGEFGRLQGYSNTKIERHIKDVNGDGMADILCFHMTLGVEIALSDGSHFRDSQFWIEDAYCRECSKDYNHFLMGDINGDGMLDVGGFYEDKFDFSLSAKKYSFINKSIDSYDNEHYFSYLPLTSDEPAFYSKDPGLSLQSHVQRYMPRIYLLFKDSNEVSYNKYHYEDALFHRPDKRLLGFIHLNRQTYKSGVVWGSMQDFELNYTYLSLHLSTSAEFINNILTRTTLFDQSYDNKGGKSYFLYYPESLTWERDPDNNFIRTVKTVMDIDNYGNVVFEGKYIDESSSHYLGDPESSYGFHQKTDNTYSIDLTHWLFPLTATESNSISPDDQQGKNVITVFTYFQPSDSRFPNVQTKSRTPQSDPSLQVVETYDYDEYGNITHKTVTAPNYTPAVSPRETIFEYDEQSYSGRFLTKTREIVTTSYSLFSEFDYYAKYGIVKTSKDYNGLETAYEYGAFGRIQRTLYPDGTESLNALRWVYADPANHPDAINGSLFYQWSQSTGEAFSLAFFDSYSRPTRSVRLIGPSEKVYADRKYNTDGQLFMVTEPYFSTDNDYAFTEHYYDNYGRPDQTIVYGGNPVTVVNSMDYDYNGLTTTLTSQPSGQFKQVTKNIIGQDVSIVDDLGTVEYIYNALGKPTIINAVGAVTKIEYDYSGQQSLLEDPNAGITTYIYSPFGDLINQVDALGNSFDMTYDATGRLLTRMNSAQNQTIEYVYDVAANGAGLLASVSGGDLSYEINYTYDNLSRLESETEAFDGRSFSKTYHYDQCGRISSIDLPSGYSIGNTYSGEGLLTSVNDVTDINNPIPLWNYGHMSARGAIEESQLGNSLDHLRTYDNLGLLLNITVPGLQDLDYEYDYSTGNMTLRRDNIAVLEETFDYDHNRLQNIYNPNGTQTMVFDDNGNIIENSELGSYNYDPNGKPHAVLSIDNPVQLPAEYEQNVEYNSENNLAEIHHINQEKDYFLYYGGMSQRIKSVYLKSSNTIRAKYYALGNHEVIVDDNGTMTRDYIGLPDGTILVLQDENNNGIEYFYILTDHLGSLGVVTDNTGQVYQWNNEEQRYSFDAWGRRRDPDTWSYLSGNEQFMFDRGYTGHEHLDAFALINMNGRTYDPILARFMMPDNFVQDGDNAQGFNRYSYAGNNPLIYTDPDGEFFFSFIGAILFTSVQIMNGNVNSMGDFFLSIGIGAAAGTAGALVGAAVAGAIGYGGFSGGATIGAASGFAGGFVGGSGNAWMNGSNFGEGLIAGLEGGAFGAVTGGLIGGTIGGIDAVRNDAIFWNGKVNEVGGGGSGMFLDEEIPAGAKPTATGEIAQTSSNPNYGKYGMTRKLGAKGKAHYGVDYAGNEGDDIFAMYDGKVIRIGNSRAYGENFVRTSSAINGKTYNVDYGHMSKRVVTLNKTVTAGQKIGEMGRLGYAGSLFPTHVHIAVWRPVNGVQGFVMPWWK
ncbi:MAG TPA: peptidoglycan DD-metalloendopeptidase family protein [Bacteroidales bacterium]|nr:peptidoglycan DD-metalloendopeptidase family protein [Bacteroidales bacterium]